MDGTLIKDKLTADMADIIRNHAAANVRRANREFLRSGFRDPKGALTDLKLTIARAEALMDGADGLESFGG